MENGESEPELGSAGPGDGARGGSHVSGLAGPWQCPTEGLDPAQPLAPPGRQSPPVRVSCWALPRPLTSSWAQCEVRWVLLAWM